MTGEHASPQELKEYGVNLFEMVRQTLLEGLELENLPEEHRKDTQETLDSVERTLDLLRTS